jgi:hypothetical protein
MFYNLMSSLILCIIFKLGVKRNTYRLLVGKPEGERSLGRLRHRWVDNIKIDLVYIGLDGLD